MFIGMGGVEDDKGIVAIARALANDPEFAKNCDRVITIVDGKIVE